MRFLSAVALAVWPLLAVPSDLEQALKDGLLIEVKHGNENKNQPPAD